MLKRVVQTARDQGWVDPHQPIEATVFLTTGQCVWALLSTHGIRHTYVKFSDQSCLCREASLVRAAHLDFGPWTAQPLGHSHEPGLDILASRAAPYDLPAPATLLSPRLGVANDLLAFFADGRLAPLPPDPLRVDRSIQLTQMAEYFQSRHAAAAEWLRRDLCDPQALWRALPQQPQHGDFVLNNLATVAGRLLVFDWEDYGVADIPGLDLFTLLMSLDRLEAAAVAVASRAPGDVGAFVAAACAAQGLSVERFMSLWPLYAMQFRYLKRNFGEQVRSRVDMLVAHLVSRSLG